MGSCYPPTPHEATRWRPRPPLCTQLCQGFALTTETMSVGYWNTTSASPLRNRTVDKTPLRCTNFIFSAATEHRRAYCAWLHPDLKGSVAPSLDNTPPICAEGYNASSNLIQAPGTIYSVGPHQSGWIVLHFVLICLHVAGWAVAVVGVDTLISLNSAEKDRGWTQGCGEASSSLARAVSPALSALLLDFGPRLWGNFSFPFLVGGALVLVCCWMPLFRGGSTEVQSPRESVRECDGDSLFLTSPAPESGSGEAVTDGSQDIDKE